MSHQMTLRTRRGPENSEKETGVCQYSANSQEVYQRLFSCAFKQADLRNNVQVAIIILPRVSDHRVRTSNCGPHPESMPTLNIGRRLTSQFLAENSSLHPIPHIRRLSFNFGFAAGKVLSSQPNERGHRHGQHGGRYVVLREGA